MSKNVVRAALLLPIWIVGSLFLWMFVGFGIPGIADYSDAGWSTINYGLPTLFLLGYLFVAWRLIRREEQ